MIIIVKGMEDGRNAAVCVEDILSIVPVSDRVPNKTDYGKSVDRKYCVISFRNGESVDTKSTVEEIATSISIERNAFRRDTK